jgi:solute carrier family 25 (peroxisomal adenine nucleotide transporter), member 17
MILLQYTVFEQLKNKLMARRTAKLRAAGLAATAATITDLDFFFLGAISKLIATSITYPYVRPNLLPSPSPIHSS